MTHALVTRWIDALTKNDMEALAALLDEGIDRTAFVARAQAVRAAHGDFVVTADEVVVNDERIAWRWTLVTASGKTLEGANFQRLSANGRVAEHWTVSREKA